MRRLTPSHCSYLLTSPSFHLILNHSLLQITNTVIILCIGMIVSFSSLKSIKVSSHWFQDESLLLAEPFNDLTSFVTGPCWPLQPCPHLFSLKSLVPAGLTHPLLPKYYILLHASVCGALSLEFLSISPLSICALLLLHNIVQAPFPQGSLWDPHI